ncbi:MAG: homoserine O-acetyltransferase MetX [Alphaproteobacteria bacterium]|jgi:homoserine O-acetyltransferase/O-succinyltransferase|tara:strand:- start:1838 stop:2962 length:1125 start_codon:yes stop_codon:yes gene_type:complete
MREIIQNIKYPGFILKCDEELILDSGKSLDKVEIAYQTYGKLNSDKSNAILVCHALTGDQFPAEKNPITKKKGWWDLMIGPGKTVDTEKYFVICSNVLGGCVGTTGPNEINPKTNKIYGIDFPTITIQDMVKVQKILIDELKIEKLLSVIGGSMGSMQVLQWAASYPESLRSIISIAGALKHSAQNIAFDEAGRQSIMLDPNWKKGNYLSEDTKPENGLSVARMIAHITYLSDAAFQKKFGRNLQEKKDLSFGFDIDFQVESYLRYQGKSFVDRFDANSYLYMTRAMDYFDVSEQMIKNKKSIISNKIRFLVVSFTSDWLFPTKESRGIVSLLNSIGSLVSSAEVVSDRGHDSFLLDEPQLFKITTGFLKGIKS